MNRGMLSIALVVAALACVPFVTASNSVLNFLVTALLLTLAGQGWNILGGYGGQYSFGHAAFFGTGAYATAILQVRYGLNAWPAFALGIAAGAAVGSLWRRHQQQQGGSGYEQAGLDHDVSFLGECRILPAVSYSNAAEITWRFWGKISRPDDAFWQR